MSKMNKRVYGVLGISSVMANWNADFSGFPKTTTKGQFFGSDKALKFPMKKMWEEEGEKVLNIKSFTVSKPDKNGAVFLVPRTLKERYEYIFGVEDMKKDKDIKVILRNLFSAIDVKNFGSTFAEAMLIFLLQAQFRLDRDLICIMALKHRNRIFYRRLKTRKR